MKDFSDIQFGNLFRADHWRKLDQRYSGDTSGLMRKTTTEKGKVVSGLVYFEG